LIDLGIRLSKAGFNLLVAILALMNLKGFRYKIITQNNFLLATTANDLDVKS
jgi:hypothetical protein